MGILKKIKNFIITTQIITIDDLETKNFKKEEWFKTNTGLDNTPKLGILTCLIYTSKKMQAIRDAINLPIAITSGYRTPEVNKAVNGSPSSKHMQGLACDFYIIGKDIEEGGKIVANACKKNKISFDKILIEKGCIHIQFNLQEKKDDNLVGFAKLINGEWVVTNA
jgi:hypothetical protein